MRRALGRLGPSVFQIMDLLGCAQLALEHQLLQCVEPVGVVKAAVAGFAARLASGYLWESASDPVERKAFNSLHAWTEVFLPGAGWVGMDPSNGVLADHHYLAAAVGREPADIEPVSGLYFGNSTVPHRLETLLAISRSPDV